MTSLTDCRETTPLLEQRDVEDSGDIQRLSSAAMSRLRVQAFSVSLDGFGAGASQGLEQPSGEIEAGRPEPHV